MQLRDGMDPLGMSGYRAHREDDLAMATCKSDTWAWLYMATWKESQMYLSPASALYNHNVYYIIIILIIIIYFYFRNSNCKLKFKTNHIIYRIAARVRTWWMSHCDSTTRPKKRTFFASISIEQWCRADTDPPVTNIRRYGLLLGCRSGLDRGPDQKSCVLTGFGTQNRQ